MDEHITVTAHLHVQLYVLSVFIPLACPLDSKPFHHFQRRECNVLRNFVSIHLQRAIWAMVFVLAECVSMKKNTARRERMEVSGGAVNLYHVQRVVYLHC